MYNLICLYLSNTFYVMFMYVRPLFVEKYSTFACETLAIYSSLVSFIYLIFRIISVMFSYDISFQLESRVSSLSSRLNKQKPAMIRHAARVNSIQSQLQLSNVNTKTL